MIHLIDFIFGIIQCGHPFPISTLKQNIDGLFKLFPVMLVSKKFMLVHDKYPSVCNSVISVAVNVTLSGVISRLANGRVGSRFLTRGIDDSGNVANSVESETILIENEESDFNFYRGSHIKQDQNIADIFEISKLKSL